MMIRAILFDIGGVLFRTEDTTPRRMWEIRLGLSEGQLAEIVYTNPVARAATIGNAAPDDVWQEVGKHLALKPKDLEMLKVDFEKGGVWDIEFLDYIHSLRPRFKTGTISDAWLGARENVVDYVNSDIFDIIVFSAEEGHKKPEPEIYRLALSRLNVAPQEAIFVDDRLPNVEGARLLGIRAIWFADSEKARSEINQMLSGSI